ncbi:MAG: UV DNA damage repair endonuclease UvsE [Pseudomonadota bacterium]
MIRFGLCCIFAQEPISFRRATASHLLKQPREEQLRRLSSICLDNARQLGAALSFCHAAGIRDFRINSQILPLKTHPHAGYGLDDLPENKAIRNEFRTCREFSIAHDLRLTFHPDQFILLSSPDPDITLRSLADLEYQTEVAELVNADVINIHGGGAYGDKSAALKRLRASIERLPDRVRSRLTLENDDRIYSPLDLVPVCRDMDIPLVYDVHHHRCLDDGLGLQDATLMAMGTWNREPLFHVSSPLDRSNAAAFRKHSDYIDVTDFPKEWIDLAITVEVEAKAKEMAVIRLMQDLASLDSTRNQSDCLIPGKNPRLP